MKTTNELIEMAANYVDGDKALEVLDIFNNDFKRSYRYIVDVDDTVDATITMSNNGLFFVHTYQVGPGYTQSYGVFTNLQSAVDTLEEAVNNLIEMFETYCDSVEKEFDVESVYPFTYEDTERIIKHFQR